MSKTFAHAHASSTSTCTSTCLMPHAKVPCPCTSKQALASCMHMPHALHACHMLMPKHTSSSTSKHTCTSLMPCSQASTQPRAHMHRHTRLAPLPCTQHSTKARHLVLAGTWPVCQTTSGPQSWWTMQPWGYRASSPSVGSASCPAASSAAISPALPAASGSSESLATTGWQ